MIEQLIKQFGGQLLGGKGGDLIGMITQHAGKLGGLGGLLQGFQQEKAQSWVSTGQNEDLTPEEAQAGLGDDFINEAAQKLGVQPHEVSQAAAQVVPNMVDQLTPEGKVDEGFDLGGMLKQFGLG
jgi:uncharacterized protein YidB (DUF937 family)